MSLTSRSKTPPRSTTPHGGELSPSVIDVFALLDDDYARSLLEALTDGARPARELLEECDGSRSTVYRRLNRMEAAGIVEARMTLHPDGHHRKEFALAAERFTFEFP